MKWVTREYVHVDRVACPWLIGRFVDQNAIFEFVPRDTDPANINDGIPFDMRGANWGTTRASAASKRLSPGTASPIRHC